MTTVNAPPDTTPPATCPTCGLPGEGFTRSERTIHHAQYQCPAGHIWITKWADLTGGAA
ncbi:MAG: hypothetical protein QM714_02770 [Nocardioides sp.]|uniref:hypothetical protein n=1 Tax=Nocardioides sp. TaxID=35761 RepID=UPI0039E52C63